MSRLWTALAVLSFIPTVVQADDWPNWGEFTREELFSSDFPEAPGAGAVVLWDSQAIKVTPKFELKVYRHCRTKIFDPAKTSRAHLTIPYWHEDDLSAFKAHTFVPPQNKVKVEKDHMHTEQVGDWKYLVVDFPSVAPGTILEYTYELRSEGLSRIAPWHFQSDEYTRASRFDLQLPPGVAFSSFFGWMPGPEPKPVRAEIRDPDKTSRLLVQNTWELKNLPPLALVPFESSAEEHRPTLFVELQSLASTQKNLKIERTWEELATAASAQWEPTLKEMKQVEPWAKAALAQAATPSEVAAAAYRLVRDDIETKEATRPEAWEDLQPARTVASGAGTGRAKNALLIGLLRSRGIDASPVLVTTARHGAFQERYHCLEQFDHMVARVSVDGAVSFLDTSDPHCPYGVLAPDISSTGLLVSAGGSTIELPPPSVRSGRTSKTTAQLGTDGSLAASAVCRWTGYPAIEARTAIASKGSDDWARKLLAARFPDASVSEIEVSGTEADDEDLVLAVSFRVSDYAERKNYDLLCVAPLPFVQAPQALRDESRRVPFDFGYASSSSDEVELLLPAGFAIAEPPAAATARTNAVLFRTKYETEGESLKLTREFQTTEVEAPPKDASALAACFDDVVIADGQTFVAKRRPARGAR